MEVYKIIFILIQLKKFHICQDSVKKMKRIVQNQNTHFKQIILILPVDQNARALPRQRYLPMDRLCTTLASVLHTSIHLKNLQKTEWRRCGRSRSD